MMATEDRRVSADWTTEFILELRRLNVSGPQIGDALEFVESYCADAAQDAEEAFGPARAYARSLGLGSPDGWRTRLGYLANAVPVAGMFVVFGAAVELIQGSTFALTWGHLAAAVLVAALGVVVVNLAFSGRTLLPAVLAGLGLTGAVTLAVVASQPLVAVPALAALLGGAVLVVGPAVVTTVRALRGAHDDDVVVSPVEPAAAALRTARRAAVIGAWAIVAATAVFAGIIAMVVHLTPAG